MSNTVVTCFWAAFILDILIVWYAFSLTKRMGKGGLLGKVTIYTALSASVFGIHHIMELLLEEVHHGVEIAESIEGIAAVLLGMAVFQLYKLTRV